MTKWNYEDAVDLAKSEVSSQMAKLVPVMREVLNGYRIRLHNLEDGVPHSTEILNFVQAEKALKEAEKLIQPRHRFSHGKGK